MPYSPKLIAEWFIRRAEEDGMYLTQMKLQKLVYIAHGWSLGMFGKPLIDAKIEAWKWGPVIPSLYSEYVHAGSGPIVGDFGDFSPVFPPEEEGLLEQTWKSYQGLSGSQLSGITHLDGTPWKQAYDPNVRFAPILDASIQSYYETLREDVKAS